MAFSIRYFTAILLLGMAPWWSMNNALRLISSRSNILKFSDKRGRSFLTTTNNKYTKTTLEAKKRANAEPNPEPPAGWTTIKFGSAEAEKNAEMEDRLREAERWVSKKLTDKESADLNRAMGIEAEVLAALAAEEDEEDGIKKKKVDSKTGKKGEKITVKSKLQEFNSIESRDAAQVKGFLELNPYICSGCGTPFQSKTQESPGFLPKDKIKEHLAKAQKIRDKQEAIKILEMAGIEVDSAAAEEILRGANISDDIIAGVRALGMGQQQSAQVSKVSEKVSESLIKSIYSLLLSGY
jgi:rubrerythrin